MDSTCSSNKKFAFSSSEKGYTIYSNELLQKIIGSSLHPAAKLLIVIVHRYSYGYMNEAAYIRKSELRDLLPINYAQIPFLINGLINANILKGGPVKCDKKGGIFLYELSINYHFAEWDISHPSRNRQIQNDLSTRAKNTTASKTNPGKKMD